MKFKDYIIFKSGATSNRKSVCIALFLNKLYLYHDVSPLNKVFTALHRSTLVCILGTISEYKFRYKSRFICQWDMKKSRPPLSLWRGGLSV